MKTPASAETQAHPSTAVSPAGTSYSSALNGRALRPDEIDGRPDPEQKATPMRRYEVACLDAHNAIQTSSHVAPALPLFEAATSAFARGTLISTPSGPVAIEDLAPGDWVTTLNGDPAPIQWIGSTKYLPDSISGQSSITGLTRILADTFGMSRPMSSLLTGPAARILHTPDQLRATAGGAKMLTPVHSFVDGVNVIAVKPPTPVQLFHFCLPRHSVIDAGGLEMETFHPGAGATHSVSLNLRNIYLSMFHHIRYMSDFGQMAYPHAPGDEYDGFSAA